MNNSDIKNKRMKIEDFIGEKVEYDPYGGTYIWGKKGEDNIEMLMDVRVRGWGSIQNHFKKLEDAEKFQDELGEWIADAINQKLKNSNIK